MTQFEFMVEKNKELKRCLVELEKKCNELIKRIDTEGTNIHHSINTDIFEMSTRIYKLSAVLGYIKTFDLKLEELDEK
tara:strand:+ start:2315 stop:2548 length:234 start_codon:yes stop_codon:yes gene_type:complete